MSILVKYYKKVSYRLKLLNLKIIRNIIKLKNSNLILGHNVIIEKGSKILIDGGQILLGDNVLLRSNNKGYHGGMPFSCTLYTSQNASIIQIGDNTRVNGAYIHAAKKIVIGMNSVIAAGVNIIDSNGHELYSLNRTKGRRDIPKEIIIGENVWIGLNVVVLKGTIIGNNSVVSANSVVKGVFPDNALISGNPGKVVKILKLNKSQ